MQKIRTILVFLLLLCASTSVGAYVTSMHAPAVLSNQNVGSLTTIELNLTPGYGGVQINGPSSVDTSTLQSAQTAAQAAASFLGYSESSYNFNYTILDSNISVSGPSAGLVFTLLAVAAMQRRQLADNFTATGTINPDGSVGEIGGVYDKMGAAKNGSMRYILVPAASNQSFEELLYYLSEQVYNLPAVEVANVSQAIPYAFGTVSPTPLSENFSQSFNIGAIANSNVTCTSCNTTAFGELVNYTLGYVNGEVENLSGFSSAKSELEGNIAAYHTLAGKGYLYTAADLAFLDFPEAFTLANSQGVSVESANSTINNVAVYCSSLTAPQLTNANYEFVVGGELRLLWANITLNNARSILSTEETSDDILQAIYTAAPALGWCNAANEAFTEASEMGGSPMQPSQALKSEAASAITSMKSTASPLYSQSATEAYDSGDYATALYAADYADTLASSSSTLTNSQLTSATLQNIGNATLGVWPSQFAAQAEFYLNEAAISHGSAQNSDISQAYAISELAAKLAAANSEISSSLVPATSQNQISSQAVNQISGLEQSLSQIYLLLLVDTVVLFLVLIVLVVHLTRMPAQQARRGRK